MSDRQGSRTAASGKSSSIAQLAEELDDSDMWVKKLSGRSTEFDLIGNSLKDVEFSLRCFHCNEFLRAPVSVIPCRHVFCSECIRTKFASDLNSTARKASCSLCNVRVDTKGCEFRQCLEPNRSADTLVHTFRLLRQPLLERLLQLQATQSTTTTTTTTTTGDYSNLVATVQQAASSSEAFGKGGCSAFDPANACMKSLRDIALAIGDGFVIPPLPPALMEGRKKLTVVSYKGRNKRQLGELCREAGLSDVGDDTTLQKRHSAYITLYNAECDSLRPRSKQELLAIMAGRDAAHVASRPRDRLSFGRGGMDLVRYHEACMEKLKQERKMLGDSQGAFWSSVATGYADFDEDMTNGFAQLIADYRSRYPKTLLRPWIEPTDNDAISANLQAASDKPSAADASAKPEAAVAPAIAPAAPVASMLPSAKPKNQGTLDSFFRPPPKEQAVSKDKGQASTQSTCLARPKDTGSTNKADARWADAAKLSAVAESKPLAEDVRSSLTARTTFGTKTSAVKAASLPHKYQELRGIVLGQSKANGESARMEEWQQDSTDSREALGSKRKAEPMAPKDCVNPYRKSFKTKFVSLENTTNQDHSTPPLPSHLWPASWTCTNCTFKNTKNMSAAARCDACDHERKVYEVD